MLNRHTPTLCAVLRLLSDTFSILYAYIEPQMESINVYDFASAYRRL